MTRDARCAWLSYTWLIAFLFLGFAAPAWSRPTLANAAIASAHPLATQAGKTILEQGGNAFDAAVAVAAALAVVEPYSSGLGGGGFFLLHRARDSKQIMLDARETAPAQAKPDMYLDAAGLPIADASLVGPRAAAIPGLPAALVWLAQHYGRLPLKQSLLPAIKLAEQGYDADSRLRSMLQTRLALLQRYPDSAAEFLQHNQVPAADARMRRPALGRTLRTLAQHGAAGFYQGPVAAELVRAVRAQGGIWTREDLARYRIKLRTPIRFDYHHMHIVSAAPPSAGGLTLGEALNILSQYDLGPLSPTQRMHLIVEALRRAYQDRARYLADPDFVPIPTAKLLSMAYAKQRAQSIRLDSASLSADLGTMAVPKQGPQTTHFSIVDRAGNRVAATLSINTLFGSGFVAGNTGVVLNNEMDDFAAADSGQNVYGLANSHANRIAPGKRPLSSMSPTFVEDKRGVLILGAPGGSRIMSMVLLAILNYEAQTTINVQAIADAPRFHHQFLPDRIEVEPQGFSAEVIDNLQLLGHIVRQTDQPWGNMQAVWLDSATGEAHAASDKRGAGSGLAWY